MVLLLQERLLRDEEDRLVGAYLKDKSNRISDTCVNRRRVEGNNASCAADDDLVVGAPHKRDRGERDRKSDEKYAREHLGRVGLCEA